MKTYNVSVDEFTFFADNDDFPTDYKLVGTQAEQKKIIGNAVEVNMARVLCEALAQKLDLIPFVT